HAQTLLQPQPSTTTSRRLRRLLALASVLLPTSAAAQPASVEAIANYVGADRQRVLEVAARREGSILLYTTGTQTRPLLERFQQKYPYLKIELVRAGSTDVARKVLEEYQAGYEKGDAFELAT